MEGVGDLGRDTVKLGFWEEGVGVDRSEEEAVERVHLGSDRRQVGERDQWIDRQRRWVTAAAGI